MNIQKFINSIRRSVRNCISKIIQAWKFRYFKFDISKHGKENTFWTFPSIYAFEHDCNILLKKFKDSENDYKVVKDMLYEVKDCFLRCPTQTTLKNLVRKRYLTLFIHMKLIAYNIMEDNIQQYKLA